MHRRAVTWVLDRNGRRVVGPHTQPGHILVAEVPARDLASAAHGLLEARRVAPGAPLMLMMLDADKKGLVEVGALAARVGARAVTTSREADWSEVLAQLCSSRDLGDHCAGWVSILRPDLAPLGLKRIRLLVDAGTAGMDVKEVAAKIGISVRDLQDFFQRTRLAAPAKYVQFGRLMPGTCLLAQRPALRLIDAAYAAGYSSASAFSRALSATFGIGVDDVRMRVGFEWAAQHMHLHRRRRESG